MKKLSPETTAFAAATARVSDWQVTPTSLHREFVLKDFAAAMRLVNAVAAAAEAANHHPDITIRWNKVAFTLSTHSVGGLTELDFDLAEKIDRLS